MGKAVGIDLGTTNSCVAVVHDGSPVVIPDEDGIRTIPSYVSFRRGSAVVGKQARQDAIEAPSEVVYAAKRLIGRAADAPEIVKAAETCSYQVIRGNDGEVVIRAGQTTTSPSEISTRILSYLKELAAKRMGEAPTGAVITVPAYFNDRQRKATKDAGEKAGLNVLRLVNEPTAAAIAYGFGKDLERRIAVYDLGGGTFDISVLDISEGVYEVVGTHGDSYLGGVDFDNRLVTHLIRKHVLPKSTVTVDKNSLLRLRQAAEQAKIELSLADSARIHLDAFLGLNLDVTVTRNELEELVKDLIAQTIAVCEQCLVDAKLEKAQIDDVILVGGMTRMPAVRRAVEAAFGKPPRIDVNPDEAVAVGAALQANSLEEGDDRILLLDVTPLTLGIASFGDIFSPVLPKNTKVPISLSRTFSTVRDDQDTVEIVVLQGESPKASENTLLGKFTLAGIPKAPRMQPKIDVTFRLDPDGILHVTARDQATGEERAISVKDFIDKKQPLGSTASFKDMPAVKAR
jgi:molecular chaperone DnaK